MLRTLLRTSSWSRPPALALLVCISSFSVAEDRDEFRSRALQEIYEFAAKYCGEIEGDGSVAKWEFGGDLSAKLGSIFSEFLEIKGGMEADVSISSYEGVLQEHAGTLFRISNFL